MARVTPTTRVIHLRKEDKLLYTQTVEAIEESFGTPLSHLYSETENAATTLSCFSNCNVVGGLIYLISDKCAVVRYIGIKRDFRGHEWGKILLDHAEHRIRRTCQLIQLEAIDTISPWYRQQGYSFVEKAAVNVDLLTKRIR